MAFPSDYDTVARAIRFLREEFKNQPSLEAVAHHVGLSPYHFQRLFTRWAGVSPKRFLQFLTVEHAKDRLRASEPVLRAALEAGLSGPARLHDLLVTTEGVTPGEFKERGAAVRIRYGVQETPFGFALLGMTSRGLCHLSFLDGDDGQGERALAEMRESWPGARFREAPDEARVLANTIFRGKAAPQPPPPLSLLLKGTNFQIRVWSALLRLPFNSLTTYGRLAGAVGRPGGARAVGSAVGKNPIAYLIPCHRVIREEGGLGGYHWGLERKAAMQGWEAARAVS
jgi:AraC family transcriptional regulator of adaptative response/methylated-DNA-[protein]-cysteine methyltransferase